jgi:hypothetical protein
MPRAIYACVFFICFPASVGVPNGLQLRINAICRRRNVPLYCGGTFGMLGYIFCDLLSHDYIMPCVRTIRIYMDATA